MKMNLQCLCAREISKELRNMSFEDRYIELQKIPKHLTAFIRGFPLNYILWACEEKIFDIEFLRSNNKKDLKKLLEKSYQEECLEGNSKKIILRKCRNYYCENLFFDSITPSKSMRHSCCSECNPIPLKLWVLIKEKILKIKEE